MLECKDGSCHLVCFNCGGINIKLIEFKDEGKATLVRNIKCEDCGEEEVLYDKDVDD